ncbi:MAG: hypothetical protein Q8N15_04460, partial [Bacillota bacterium]|nr:hypothetical protein [Bacillota bacterium]
LQLTKKERTNIACYEYFLQSVRAYRVLHRNVSVDVIAINRADWGDRLVEAIGRENPDIRIHLTQTLSPVFFIHLGDQGFGIAMTGE